MPGGGTLSISLENTQRGEVAVNFRDTGGGLTKEEQERIFEPFESSFNGGTGLGLSIVLQIIEAHHGSIKVASAKGAGTTFQITLPKEMSQPEVEKCPTC